MAILKRDPTRTTGLRRRFMVDMRKRFNNIKKMIREAIVDLDVFGLKDPQKLSFNEEPINNALPPRQAYAFQTNARKIESFNTWLQAQLAGPNAPLSIEGGTIWSGTYVDSAYRQGVVRAYNQSRPLLSDESLDFAAGRRSEFLESSFAHGERLSKIEFLYTRQLEELKGITAAMSQQINRILADGLSRGVSPTVMAREISNTITKITRTRALTMARTEVIRAHAEGQLDAFEELGVDELRLMAEWSTAGSGVCELCEPLEGAVMTIREARGLIPRHPNCRCAWIPANVGERSARELKRDRAATKGKVKDSLKAGLPKKTRAGDKVPQTLPEAKKRSTWEGKDKKF